MHKASCLLHAALAACFGVALLAQQLDPMPQSTPQGLTDGEWTSIRAAYEAGRHKVTKVEGAYQVRDPGQGWLTRFEEGWPGQRGVPTLTTSADPVSGAKITLYGSSSSGLPSSQGLLTLGVNKTAIPFLSGTLLTSLDMLVNVKVPGTGMALPVSVPLAPTLCGAALHLQLLQLDPAASQGVSFTQGLSLTIMGSDGGHVLGSQGQVTFAAFGDYGIQWSSAEDVANLVKGLNPDFIISVGDNNYQLKDPNPAKRLYRLVVGDLYCNWIHNPSAGSDSCNTPGRTRNMFFPVFGNHDWDDKKARYVPGAYVDFFELPGPGHPPSANERYYDFVIGDVHFFALNTNAYNERDGTTSDSIQGKWLENGLKKSTSPWKVVYGHKAPYASSLRSPILFMRWPYAQWGADVVMSGHEHFYERLEVDKIPYFVVGTGGGGINGRGPTIPQSKVVIEEYGALFATASSVEMTLKFISRTNAVLDSLTLRKTRASFTTFGLGCASASILPVISSISTPRLGQAFTLHIRGFLPQVQTGQLMLGTSSSTWGSIPLPLDLHLLGMTGCNLLVGLRVPAPFITDALGNAAITSTIPTNSSLVGAKLYGQAWAPDAAANALGIATSNAFQMVLGY